MRRLRSPRLDKIETPSGSYWRRQEIKLPPCRAPHGERPGVRCTLDNGHRSDLHAATSNGEVLRW